MSNPLTFIVNGREVTAEQLAKETKPAAKKTSAASLKRVESREHAKQSQGFAVLGYSADQMAVAAADYANRLKEHFKGEGEPHPGTAEEHRRSWMNKNKPKRVGRPYNLLSSAEECMALSERAGWSFLRIEELLKG